MKQQVVTKLRQVADGLESGSLQVEMFHENKTMGNAEMNTIIEGDYLMSSHRIHFVTREDWATELQRKI